MAAKRGRNAPIWDYMELSTPEQAVCLVCKDTFKFNGSTTSNLIKHLRVKHPIEYAAFKDENDCAVAAKSSKPSTSKVQPTLIETMSRTQMYKNDSEKKRQLDEMLVRMIVEDLQPLSIVEDRGFRRLLHSLNPRYELPSRREIGRTLLPGIYKKETERIKKELEKAKDIALTTDIWTSRQTKGFITVTAHFISPEWELKSAVLETVRLTKAHTANNIAEELQLICNKWNMMDKVCSIVTDNAANMVSAIKAMNIRQIPCFAHTLNLAVQTAVKDTNDVERVKEKLKQVVSFFHHSVKASDKLSELQGQNNMPAKKLIQDVETRWNSTFYMMERYLQQHELVTTTLCLLGRSDMCLNSDECKLLQSIVDVLEPFEEATKEMSTEKVTSLSKLIPMVRGIQDCINSSNVSDDHSLVQELKKQMEKRFPVLEGNSCLAAATLLDPRFKKVPFADKSNIKKVEDRLVTLMRKDDPQNNDASTLQVKVVKPVTVTTCQKKKSLWCNFDSKMQNMASSSPQPSTGPYIELRRYLEEPHIARDSDPLAWWKQHETLFPKLSEVAKKFLCIPASSVPSERLFSKAGELISHRRSSLKEENINMILFLNKNM